MLKSSFLISVILDLKSMHDNIRKVAESWVSTMDHETKTGILTHYGDMPGLEHEYWKLASGPAWCWWVLAIMPLDQNAQVGGNIKFLKGFKSLAILMIWLL